MHYVAGFLRRGLGFFLISLLALLVGNLSSTEPVPSQNQRFEFHDDIQALLLSLPDSFRRELSACRTFIPQEAAAGILAQGIGKRVSMRDLLVFGPHGPIDNTLRFPDECVRHKLLDVVGDLALTGCEVIGHVVAYRCGHQLNAELAKRLLEQITVADQRFETVAQRRCA